MNFIRGLGNALLEFIFPKSEKTLALESLSPAEMLQLLPSARDTGDPNLITIFAYSHPQVRAIIWELKYKGNRNIASKLAHILTDVLQHELSERVLFDNFQSAILVPIPISRKRRESRGYNQTEILAEEMKKLDGNMFELRPLLTKHRHTESQILANRAERLHNLTHSMQVNDCHAVKNRNIILLDDVTTTGATFVEAKRALSEAGAKSILCVAVAH